MNHPDPTPFLTAFNAWDRNDLDAQPAAVGETSIPCLPETPSELMALLPEPHRTFMDDTCGPDYQTLTFAEPETITGFDPTADMLPDASETEAGREASSQATNYFENRPVTVVEVTGNDVGHELMITLRIAHDREGARIFSFLQVSN